MSKKGKTMLHDLGLWSFPDKRAPQDLDPKKLAEQGHFYEAARIYTLNRDQDGLRSVIRMATEAGDLVDARFGERMIRKLTGDADPVLTEDDLERIASNAEAQGKPGVRVYLNKERFNKQGPEEQEGEESKATAE